MLLVIADGVGVAPEGPSNAVTLAETPALDALTSGELYTQLAAHGPAVGLPSDDDMGNSEVGHNALGAGQGVRPRRQARQRRDRLRGDLRDRGVARRDRARPATARCT